VTPIDLQLIPQVWRAPEAARPGKYPGTYELQARLAGWNTVVTFDRGVFAGAAPSSRWGVRTFWVKREGVQP
jgi:hypothetical protein